MKNLEDDTDNENDENRSDASPDRGYEMGRISRSMSHRHNDSQRGMLQQDGSSSFSDRFGSVHANETAMEYF